MTLRNLLALAVSLLVASRGMAAEKPAFQRVAAKQPANTGGAKISGSKSNWFAAKHSPDQLAKGVDAALEKRWRQEKLTPSAPCTDYEFLRRVCLDLAGTIPPEELVREFAADPSPNKRQAIVEKLLASDGYARFSSVLWGNALVGRGRDLELLAQLSFRQWLAEQFAKNAPFDKVVRDMLTASGSRQEDPAVGWAMQHKTPEELAGAAARVFLGTQIQCAQCHDHPFDSWKQRDFYGLAAFFGQTQYQRIILAESFKDLGSGEIRLGSKSDGPVIAPRFLGVDQPAALDARPRREQLADWLTSPENPLFARAIVNRVWAQLFGRGFVHPLDDFSANNPPSSPEALDLLAESFAASGYDMQKLLRAITRTRAYQLSSLPSRNNRTDEALFSKHLLRRLLPEQLLPAVVMSASLATNKDLMENPLVKLLLLAVEQQFIFVFANMDETTQVSEFQGTISQALLMMNSKAITGATRLHLLHPLAIKLLKESTPEKQVELLFLSTVSRPPTTVELQQLRPQFMSARGPMERLEVCEDLYWALVNTAEFTLNH